MGFYDIGLTYDPKRATPRTLTDNDLKGIVASAGWISGTPFSCAQRVVIAESSKRTDATSANPAGGLNIGIFQIWQGNVRYPDHLKDPVYCANVARRMYIADGGTFTKRWESAAKGNLPPEPALQDDATNATDNASRSLTSGIDAVGDFFNRLTDGELWKRIGLIVIGGVLTVVAVLIIAGEFKDKIPIPPVIPV